MPKGARTMCVSLKKHLLECGAAVAQVTVNHLVAGSNPAIPAKFTTIVEVVAVSIDKR